MYREKQRRESEDAKAELTHIWLSEVVPNWVKSFFVSTRTTIKIASLFICHIAICI